MVENRSHLVSTRTFVLVWIALLCLLLWRERDGVLVLRVPLLGRASVPVTTRPLSQVTLTVGGRVFGPTSSGKAGRVVMRVLVPPGISRGEVEVVDEKGFTTRRPTEIRRPSYPLLAVGVRPAATDAAEPRFEVTVATAELDGRPMEVEVVVGGKRVALTASSFSAGRFVAHWAPRPRPEAGRARVEARHAGSPVVAHAEARILPLPVVALPSSRPLVVRRPQLTPTRPARRLRGRVAASTGFVHNTHALFSPRFGLEAAADYPIGPGRIGVLLSLSFAWTRTAIAVGGMGEAGIGVLLAPIGVGVGYRFTHKRFTATSSVSVMGQIVRTASEGLAGDEVRTGIAPGVQLVVGGELALGRGGVFAQAGLDWCRVDRAAVEGLAGGLLFEVGYRFEI